MSDWKTISVTLTYEYGLHMRPSWMLTQGVGDYDCEIRAEAHGYEVDGKVVTQVTLLAATCGDVVLFKARGRDAGSAIKWISDFINELNSEGEDYVRRRMEELE
ncbi:MAG: HPr family phosphocarrier protein [Phycisphaerales bacterium]|nr:MAG: HPr family phosphocarrier protein [Phycisphaerales bacterium]